MFFFGDPEDTARLYWRSSTEIKGPLLAEAPLDEMSEQELRNALTYARIAYKKALQDGAGAEVMAILLDQHDEVFQALAEASERFRKAVRGNYCAPITGYDHESIEKYKKLAGVMD